MFQVVFDDMKTGASSKMPVEAETVKDCVQKVFEGEMRPAGCVVMHLWEEGEIIPLPVTVDDQQRVLHNVPGAAEKMQASLQSFYDICAA